jgi:hypothetical protein
MAVEGESSRDLAALVVQLVGGLSETGERYEPYRLVDADGTVVKPVASYFRDLLAAGRAESTVRSYGMDLSRWFGFCGRSGSSGTGRLVLKSVISLAGFRSRASHRVRTGVSEV